MRHGFVKVAAVTPNIRVADVEHNTQEICKWIGETVEQGAKVIAFPELAITGATCGDLFTQGRLLQKAEEALDDIIEYTTGMDALVFVGLPYVLRNKLYNVAAVIQDGELLGMVPKVAVGKSTPFEAGKDTIDGDIPFGPKLLFYCDNMPNFVVAAEVGADLWAPIPKSREAALAGATILVNCGANHEMIGSDDYARELVKIQSASVHAGYVYANAGAGESTTDLVFGGENYIAENGALLKTSQCFTEGVIYSEIDVERLVSERYKNPAFTSVVSDDYIEIPFLMEEAETTLTREIEVMPFVPANEKERIQRCEKILTIQAMGLKKRLEHAHCKSAVVGISGGLDSTLALLVTAKAFDLLGLDRSQITSVTMPCFGTTDRTYQNACTMTRKLGATLKEVNIKNAVRIHFEDIGHDEKNHDVTFENAQARERTQVLMDIANMTGGMVIGTGDMSELALGWATYNGDHMSMYGVNGSIPKTLVRHLVRYYADTCTDTELQAVLYDVLDTPVSPELLPPEDGEIAQKTEDLVGPYELHDFFLYYILRLGYEPSKIYRLAKYAFAGAYEDETILKWLKTFYRRFFMQQFKRSCLPDGPKVGTVDVSPRGGLKMPSDACQAIWLQDLENL